MVSHTHAQHAAANDRPQTAGGPAWMAPDLGPPLLAGIACWAAIYRVWMEAGCAFICTQPAAPVEDPLLHQTMEDLRSCSDAIVSAQIEALQSWRRAP